MFFCVMMGLPLAEFSFYLGVLSFWEERTKETLRPDFLALVRLQENRAREGTRLLRIRAAGDGWCAAARWGASERRVDPGIVVRVRFSFGLWAIGGWLGCFLNVLLRDDGSSFG
jgi:hypothetical protein